jgi:hydrogenase maturation protein HypF
VAVSRPAAARADESVRRRRVRARVRGTVQGVGFRPYVHRLASELGLAGFVLNDERGVLLEVEGDGGSVDAFLARLPAEAPPLATVEHVAAGPLAPTGVQGFAILASERTGEALALVPVDTATCADCLAELRDPADRRFRHPFVTCTNCGPRFTIVRDVPYDRARTTMAGFAMCDRCRAEYTDPADRRFHAEPIACPDCGPVLRLVDAGGAPIAGDPVAEAAAALRAGRIMAVKGLGGFHLACRADREGPVLALRERKRREEKPFALMAADLAAARRLVVLEPAEEELLTGPERPIVLARRRKDARVARAVAPRSADLGVMLPSTPLHHLLLDGVGTGLVMTSGNASDEPIAFRDADALERLAGICDLLLLHDRPIHMRADDSIVRAVPGRRPLVLRRARGRVPASIALPAAATRPVLGCGAELKSTFCLAKGVHAWVGQHIGDLRTWEALEAFREGVAHVERLFAVRPEVVAHDLHPDYLSTGYALDRDGVEHVAVQHHHAHLAAVLAEHGVCGPAVGAIFDGTGIGPDGTVWGGELLAGDAAGYERAGHLAAVRLPGGDRAAREPWRMACAWLAAALGEAPEPPLALAAAVDPGAWDAVARLACDGGPPTPTAPLTTSMGRLFDATAALCGLRARTSYEGQAAAELEAAAAASHDAGSYALPVRETGGGLVLDAGETILAVARDVARGAPPEWVAARFHRGVAAATAAACAALAEARGVATVVLAGGVWQNRVLLAETATALERRGLRVLVPERLPPNDGAISYGQVAVAVAQDRRG